MLQNENKNKRKSYPESVNRSSSTTFGACSADVRLGRASGGTEAHQDNPPIVVVKNLSILASAIANYCCATKDQNIFVERRVTFFQLLIPDIESLHTTVSQTLHTQHFYNCMLQVGLAVAWIWRISCQAW